MNIWTFLSAGTAVGIIILEYGVEKPIEPSSAKFMFFLFLGFAILAVLDHTVRGSGSLTDWLKNSKKQNR